MSDIRQHADSSWTRRVQEACYIAVIFMSRLTKGCTVHTQPIPSRRGVSLRAAICNMQNSTPTTQRLDVRSTPAAQRDGQHWVFSMLQRISSLRSDPSRWVLHLCAQSHVQELLLFKHEKNQQTGERNDVEEKIQPRQKAAPAPLAATEQPVAIPTLEDDSM